ncbi:MAG: AAA family ATPase [Dehalogenimonas sp.]
MAQLPEVIQALLDPAQYPDDAPSEVKLLQTQMSFVLLNGKHAYKIRKPVNLGYVDYTTLEKRKLFSEKEVYLNRRLCPDTYLGVVSVTRKDDKIRLGGEGEIIDYAVKMKQLPAEGMLDLRLKTGDVKPEVLEFVARAVANVHDMADTNGEIARFGEIDGIRRNVEENFEQSRPYIGRALNQSQFEKLKEYFDTFLEQAILFVSRVERRHIRDCHGDLHSAHICFQDHGICIFDCIEFNDRFRYGDTASEVAFLAMDLDHYGRADLRRIFIDEYVKKSGDTGLCELLRFYQAYRAHIRAKVACFKLDDPFVPEAEKAEELAKAQGYFDLELSYTRPKPALIIMSGYTGSGKSAVATELAKHLGLVYISSDVTRKTLAGLPLNQRSAEGIDAGLYSREMTEKTYQSILMMAEGALKSKDSAIVDATFLSKEQRMKAADIARRNGADFIIIECRLDEDELKLRLQQRMAGVSDGTWQVYLSQKSKAEPVTEVPTGANHVIIDALRPISDNVRHIIDNLT